MSKLVVTSIELAGRGPDGLPQRIELGDDFDFAGDKRSVVGLDYTTIGAMVILSGGGMRLYPIEQIRSLDYEQTM